MVVRGRSTVPCLEQVDGVLTCSRSGCSLGRPGVWSARGLVGRGFAAMAALVRNPPWRSPAMSAPVRNPPGLITSRRAFRRLWSPGGRAPVGHAGRVVCVVTSARWRAAASTRSFGTCRSCVLRPRTVESSAASV